MVNGHRMTFGIAAAAALLFGVALALAGAPAEAAKCDRADARLARTGKGDRDGDGISNCRERRLLRTSVDDVDSDDDGMDDGDEVAEGCDPLDPDSDGDGTHDGEDDSPAPPPRQKIEALLDALTCPQTGVPGSLTALGISVALTDATEFDDTTCEELAAALAAGPTLVEVEVLEDEAGALTAREVELEDDEHDGDHEHGDDDDEDDDDQGEDEDEDDDD
jgi:hypothetical protein